MDTCCRFCSTARSVIIIIIIIIVIANLQLFNKRHLTINAPMLSKLIGTIDTSFRPEKGAEFHTRATTPGCLRARFETTQTRGRR